METAARQSLPAQGREVGWGGGYRASLRGGVTQLTHTLPCSWGPVSQVSQMAGAVRLVLGPGQEAPASLPDLVWGLDFLTLLSSQFSVPRSTYSG